MKRLIIAVLFITITGCRKEGPLLYTIQGQIIESTSNPVPVKNYDIFFYQSAANIFLGGVSGIEQMIKTDNNGNFLLKYDPAQNYGFSSGGINDNTISISGVDTIQFRGLYPRWSPIASAVNINLGKLYLYKKIDRLIRKIKFDSSLLAGESVDIMTTNANSSIRKTITGPVPAGTFLTVDTIYNCRLSYFNLTDKTYSLTVNLIKLQSNKYTVYILPVGDETQMEVQITY
jgi:hypothetical protein